MSEQQPDTFFVNLLIYSSILLFAAAIIIVILKPEHPAGWVFFILAELIAFIAGALKELYDFCSHFSEKRGEER